jgi:hypothetical protein
MFQNLRSVKEPENAAKTYQYFGIVEVTRRNGGKLLVDATLVPTRDSPKLQKLAKEMDISIVPKNENAPSIKSALKQTDQPESIEPKAPNLHFQCEIPESISNKSVPVTDMKKSEPDKDNLDGANPSASMVYSPEDPVMEANTFTTRFPVEAPIYQGASHGEENTTPHGKYAFESKSVSRSPSSKVWEKVSQFERKSISNSSSNIFDFLTPEAQKTSLEPKSLSRSAQNFPEVVQTMPEWREVISSNKGYESKQYYTEPHPTQDNKETSLKSNPVTSKENMPSKVQDCAESARTEPYQTQETTGSYLKSKPITREEVLQNPAFEPTQYQVYTGPDQTKEATESYLRSNPMTRQGAEADNDNLEVKPTSSKVVGEVLHQYPSDYQDVGDEHAHEMITPPLSESTGTISLHMKNLDDDVDDIHSKIQVTGHISKNQSIHLIRQPTQEGMYQGRESEMAGVQDIKIRENQTQDENESSLDRENQEVGNLDSVKATEPIIEETDDTWPAPPSKEDLVIRDAHLDHSIVPEKLCEWPMCFCQALVKVGDLHHDDIKGTSWRIIERKTKKIVYRKI